MCCRHSYVCMSLCPGASPQSSPGAGCAVPGLTCDVDRCATLPPIIQSFNHSAWISLLYTISIIHHHRLQPGEVDKVLLIREGLSATTKGVHVTRRPALTPPLGGLSTRARRQFEFDGWRVVGGAMRMLLVPSSASTSTQIFFFSIYNLHARDSCDRFADMVGYTNEFSGCAQRK